MKYLAIIPALLILSCQPGSPDPETITMEKQNIETTIHNLYVSLRMAYTNGGIDTDSLLDIYYDPSAYYVTPWGTTEIMDSTKSRLRSALGLVTNFDFSIESFTATPYGRGATAFFILRQDYLVDGAERSEYLPTSLVLEKKGDQWKIVHSHRSTDPETWNQWFSRTP